MSQAIGCIDDCTGITSRGVENAATPWIKELYKKLINPNPENAETFARPKERCREMLNTTYVECSEENWDGYGARPVSDASLFESVRFINELPSYLPAPSDISADPDGHITMEWRNPRGLIFAMSFSGTGEVYYAGLLGVNKPRGTSYFINSIPKDLIEKIQSVGL